MTMKSRYERGIQQNQSPVGALQAFTGLCHMMRNDLCFYCIPINRENSLLQICCVTETIVCHGKDLKVFEFLIKIKIIGVAVSAAAVVALIILCLAKPSVYGTGIMGEGEI